MPARVRAPPPPPAPVRLGGIARYDSMPPRGPLGLRRWFWKKCVQVDAHLSFGMLEWWEAIIVALIVFPITALFWYSAFTYFPSHFRYLSKRFSYYVFEDENVDALAAFRGVVAEWLNVLWLWVTGSAAVAAAAAAGAGGSSTAAAGSKVEL